MGKTPIIRDLLKQKQAELTAAERKLVAILSHDSMVAGLQSITKLAESAEVSTPTVVRLARKLGFEGYSDLQDAIREEIAARMKQPLAKLASAEHDAPRDHIVARFAEAASANMNRTLEQLDTDAFDAVAELLSDPERRLFFLGGRITRATAQYLYGHLQIIRPATTLLDSSPSVWPQSLLDMDARGVLVLFDIRRYEKELARLAALARARGTTVVLFTDLWGSPIEAHAAHSFRSAVEAPSSWDSTLAMTFLVEAMIAAVQARCSDSSAERISALEGMIGETKIFAAS